MEIQLSFLLIARKSKLINNHERQLMLNGFEATAKVAT